MLVKKIELLTQKLTCKGLRLIKGHGQTQTTNVLVFLSPCLRVEIIDFSN